MSDPTWSALTGSLDERRRMDLVCTVAAFHLVALAVNAFGVLDDGS